MVYSPTPNIHHSEYSEYLYITPPYPKREENASPPNLKRIRSDLSSKSDPELTSIEDRVKSGKFFSQFMTLAEKLQSPPLNLGSVSSSSTTSSGKSSFDLDKVTEVFNFSMGTIYPKESGARLVTPPPTPSNQILGPENYITPKKENTKLNIVTPEKVKTEAKKQPPFTIPPFPLPIPPPTVGKGYKKICTTSPLTHRSNLTGQEKGLSRSKGYSNLMVQLQTKGHL